MADWSLIIVRFTIGISLINSLRASTTSTSSVCDEWRSASANLFCSRARFASVPCVAIRYAPKTRNKANKNTRKEMIIFLFLEEDAWQLQTTGFESFGKAGSNTCRTETADNFALLVNTRSLVHEYFL